MKTTIDCQNCEASFSVISSEEPQYCAFCGETVKLYEKEKPMIEYNLLSDDDDLLDDDFDEDFDEDFEDEDEELDEEDEDEDLFEDEDEE